MPIFSEIMRAESKSTRNKKAGVMDKYKCLMAFLADEKRFQVNVRWHRSYVKTEEMNLNGNSNHIGENRSTNSTNGQATN